MTVSCLLSLFVTTSKRLWQDYPVGLGPMLVKFEPFGFTPRGVDKAMGEAYWNPPNRKLELVGAK